MPSPLRAAHHPPFGSFGTCPPPSTPARFARPRALWRSREGLGVVPSADRGEGEARGAGRGGGVRRVGRQSPAPPTRENHGTASQGLISAPATAIVEGPCAGQRSSEIPRKPRSRSP